MVQSFPKFASSLQLVPVTRIEKKPSGDDEEVMLSLQDKGADALGPYGPVIRNPPVDRRSEWLFETESHQGTQPKKFDKGRPPVDFDQAIDSKLGAAGGTTGRDVVDHGTPAPRLPPEQQILHEDEIRTPPRRELRGNGGQRPIESRLPSGGATMVPEIFTDDGTKGAGRSRRGDEWSLRMALEDTVISMEHDLEELQAENRFLKTPRAQTLAPITRQAVLTMTKVLWFNGTTSWEQYQQVFDAIVLSNGWGYATAALQLLSLLQGDALNVALLIPMPRRASRKEVTDTLSAHYGSQGRLADYRRQFDKTVRKPGEDPSSFAIALETLAVKAFDVMGQTALLRLIRDRFIAGHSSCELRRYLDSVPPETPIWDVVDRCRVWESHADPEIRQISKPNPEPTYPTYAVNESEHGAEAVRVVTVNKPNNSLDQVEELMKRLLVG